MLLTPLRKPLLALMGAGALLFGATVVVGAGAALAAPGGGECQVTGNAVFSPNGPGNTSAFAYSFLGPLSSCQSNVTGAPTSGTLEVGQVKTESVPITTSTGVVQGTAKYQEAPATGSGNIPANSCPAGATSGTGVTTWPDGSTTVASFTTQSAGAGVALQGSVVGTMTLTLVAGSESPAGTAPATFVISTTNPSFPVGDGVAGALTFTTSDPTQCTTAGGLSSAAVQGTLGLGSTS